MARHLITSAIPYINGIKHLGNLVGSQLPADLYARYLRARGHEVLFLCATDEHGTPAELAAKKADKPVAEYCAEMHKVQEELANGFRLSFDHFGRSSSPQNHRLTQHFAAKLDEAGLIREVSETQMYSPEDGRFLPDRYIEGTCPNCGFDSARGDQCDNCTKQLDPVDLIDPRSTISGATNLEMRETKHLFLCQSKMRDELAAWIDSKTDWPVLTTSIAKKWLFDGDGLQDRGITRDLDWGIPVKKGDADWPGMEGKVFYVWFDAPIEYIACAQEWEEAGKGSDWQRWWRTDEGADDVRYTQFMGKDNVPFHTLGFPATILGSGEPWKLVDYIKSFNYLNYEGGQFSTSRGRGVFMDQALEILPADYWRWWLLSPCAREQRRRVHLGEFPVLREQGPRRRARQLRQPRDQVLPLQVRRSRARRRRVGRARKRSGGRAEGQARRVRGPDGGDGDPQGGRVASCDLGRGQRIPSGGRAMGDLQGGSRDSRDADPARAEPHPPLRGAVAALHSRCLGAIARGARSAGGGMAAGPRDRSAAALPPDMPSPCRT